MVSRAGCHLCELAEQAIRRLGIQVEMVDVDQHPDLLQAFDFRVPVLLRQGAVIAEGNLDDSVLLAAIGA